MRPFLSAARKRVLTIRYPPSAIRFHSGITMTGTILLICAAIAASVFAVMLYSVATFRTAPQRVGVRRNHNTVVELLWTLVPIVIFVGAVIPALNLLGPFD
jgi:cytochrome c oxidase subunit 2